MTRRETPWSLAMPGRTKLRANRLQLAAPPYRTAVQRALWRDGLGAYEPATMVALLALFEGARRQFVFHDVGANIGLYAILCAKLFRPGAVVAFEPTPDVAALAARLATLNDVDIDVRQVALGEQAGTLPLFLSDKSDSSNSLVKGFKRSSGTVDVEVQTLDDVVRTSQAPDIIKIDVETFEPSVLGGAQQLLREHRPTLVLEVLHRRGHDHGEDLMPLLNGLDYCMYRLQPGRPPQREDRICGDPSNDDNDWLLSAQPLDEGFAADVARWETRLAECGPPEQWQRAEFDRLRKQLKQEASD